MGYKIEDIEGIGAANAQKLARSNIRSTDDLLKLCADPAGRSVTSSRTGLPESQLLKWANHADLMRIKGIGGEFSELLEAAGVDTVRELQQRNPDSLATALIEVNEKKHLTRTVPGADTLSKWIADAKALPPRITY